jgi:hypothetical protein
MHMRCAAYECCAAFDLSCARGCPSQVFVSVNDPRIHASVTVLQHDCSCLLVLIGSISSLPALCLMDCALRATDSVLHWNYSHWKNDACTVVWSSQAL